MTDGWNGDPAQGCGLMILLGIGLWLVLAGLFALWQLT